MNLTDQNLQAAQTLTLTQAGFTPSPSRESFAKNIGSATIRLFPLPSGLLLGEVYLNFDNNGPKVFHLVENFGKVLTNAILCAALEQDPDSFEGIEGEIER